MQPICVLHNRANAKVAKAKGTCRPADLQGLFGSRHRESKVVSSMTFEDEHIEETWSVIQEMTDCLDAVSPLEIVVSEFLKPPIHENLAKCFLQQRKKDGCWQILTSQQLEDIASSMVDSEKDIRAVPGVYLFLSLATKQILKVGQSGNLRERICNGHLRYSYGTTQSSLADYYTTRERNWPEALVEEEIVGLLFPMYNSDEQDRCFIEFGFEKMLIPEMP